jgi:hypothetical protein
MAGSATPYVSGIFQMTDPIESTAHDNAHAPSPRQRNTVLIKCTLPHGITLGEGAQDG